MRSLVTGQACGPDGQTVVESASLRVARKAIGAQGQVVLQQWLAHTTPRHAIRRPPTLRPVVYEATANGGGFAVTRRPCHR